LGEVFAGSGTGFAVAKDLGIKYVGVDLNPTPVRPGIISADALMDDVPDEFRNTDMVFMHPPYPEIGIKYAGSMYQCDASLKPKDIGQMSWEDGMKAINQIIMKYYSALDTGSRMAVLSGDVRRRGRFRSMLLDMVQPGELEQVIIKMQHNCVSNGRSYQHKNFVPLVHENILVLKKPIPFMMDFCLPVHYKLDLRDSKTPTWTDIVAAAMRSLGGSAELERVYAAIDGHKRCQRNQNWQAKVRQVLNQHPKLFRSERRGVWALVS
jgi:hypothetical protein